jgi:hypothetical protein
MDLAPRQAAAAKYHTARFILVPSLREELTVAWPEVTGALQEVDAGTDGRDDAPWIDPEPAMDMAGAER